MFTLIGYYDATAHAALAAVAAIADPHVRVTGNDIYVPDLNLLMGVLAAGADLSQCRLQSPSLRRLANQRIAPVASEELPLDGKAVATEYHAEDPRMYFQNYSERARPLDIAEALNAYCINAGATNEWILVWLMDRLEALPAGSMISIEGTINPTGVAGAWINGAITFVQTLPAGRYAVIGMRIEDTAVAAARLVFVGHPWRPGVVGSFGTQYPDIPLFRNGSLGSWGEFEHDAPPTVDTLCNAAGAVTPEVVLDLIQIRAGRR